MINSKIQNLMVRRANEDESGFTLIELLIVMIIIGVLAAIAIPAFLNQQKGARDTQTTSDVRNAAIAVQTLVTQYPDAQGFALYAAETGGAAADVTASGATNVAYVGARNGAADTPREKVTLSAGTVLRVTGNATAGETDQFVVSGWNAKGKNYTSNTAARVYESANGGLQSAAKAAPAQPAAG